MLANLSIRLRLLILTLVPLVALLAVMALAVNNASRLNRNFEELFIDRMQPISQIKTVADAYAVNMVDTLHKYRAGMLDDMQVRRVFDESRQLAGKAWAAYGATRLTAEERRRFERTESLLHQADRLTETYLGQLGDPLRNLAADDFNRQLYSTFDPLSAELDGLVRLQLDEGEKLHVLSQSDYQTTRNSFLGLGFLVAVLVLVASWVITRSIIRPLNAICSAIGEVQRSSDLTLRAPIEGRDELAHTASAFNALLEHFHGVIRHLRDASTQLAAASEEMSAISAQVSDVASQQGQQTVMVATAVHEMSAAIQEVANLRAMPAMPSRRHVTAVPWCRPICRPSSNSPRWYSRAPR